MFSCTNTYQEEFNNEKSENQKLLKIIRRVKKNLTNFYTWPNILTF